MTRKELFFRYFGRNPTWVHLGTTIANWVHRIFLPFFFCFFFKNVAFFGSFVTKKKRQKREKIMSLSNNTPPPFNKKVAARSGFTADIPPRARTLNAERAFKKARCAIPRTARRRFERVIKVASIRARALSSFRRVFFFFFFFFFFSKRSLSLSLSLVVRALFLTDETRSLGAQQDGRGRLGRRVSRRQRRR